MITSITPKKTALILTHLVREGGRAYWKCMRLWNLKQQDSSISVFDLRISLTNSMESYQPKNEVDENPPHYVYSSGGSLCDNGISEKQQYLIGDYPPVIERKLIQPEHEIFVLGGGNLERCLRVTFVTLVNLRIKQETPAQILIGLPYIYHLPRMFIGHFPHRVRIFNYEKNGPVGGPPSDIKDSNYCYYDHLRHLVLQGKLTGFKVSIDGENQDSLSTGNHFISLNWFTTEDSFPKALW